MKYFLVLIEYKTDIDNIISTTDQHRAHLKKGYEKGMLLISGPQVPRTGGVFIARSRSREELEDFIYEDPYFVKSYADYKITEFDPKSYHPDISDWVTSQ